MNGIWDLLGYLTRSECIPLCTMTYCYQTLVLEHVSRWELTDTQLVSPYSLPHDQVSGRRKLNVSQNPPSPPATIILKTISSKQLLLTAQLKACSSMPIRQCWSATCSSVLRILIRCHHIWSIIWCLQNISVVIQNLSDLSSPWTLGPRRRKGIYAYNIYVKCWQHICACVRDYSLLLSRRRTI